jgi:long-chain fatty acid transport protein
MKRVIFLVFCLCLVLAPLSGYGAGYQIYVEQGAAAMGMGAAFVAKADNPTAVFFNPAGITQLKGTQMTFNYTTALLDSKLKGAYNPYTTAPNEPAHEDMEDHWAQIPSFYITHQINKKWFMGFGVFAPYGTMTDWNNSWVGRYYSDKTDLKTYDFNPTIAYKFNDKFSVAVGLNYMYSEVTIKKSIPYAATLAKIVNPVFGQKAFQRNYDVDLDLGGHGDGWGFNVGLLFQPNKQWSFGLAYRSNIDLGYDGHAEYNRHGGVAVLDKMVQMAGGPANFSHLLFPNTRISSDLRLPDTVAFGVMNRSIKNLTLELDVMWTKWDTYDSMDIEFDDMFLLKNYTVRNEKDWDNVWAIRVGAEYQINPCWVVRAGYIYDQSPVPNRTRSPELAGSDRNDISVGFGYTTPGKTLSVDAAYLISFFEDAHSYQKYLKGKYETTGHVVSVALTYRF